jgi:HSP20 family protein
MLRPRRSKQFAPTAEALRMEVPMSEKKLMPLVPDRLTTDPFSLLRQMTSSLEHAFDDWPGFRFSSFGGLPMMKSAGWSPKIDMFEREHRLVTRIDLPGMKKEDVSVEVTDGHLVVSGERKRETEETRDSVYRKEREYGSFYRALPLPEGIRLEDVIATFANGVLEVSVPLPAPAEANVRKVQIEEPKPDAKTAA